MSALFVQKPRLAFTFSILLIIAGLIAYTKISVSLLPDINKPAVRITAFYPSANPTALEQTFLLPVEQALNGIKGMNNIKSFVTDSGFVIIKVTFNSGTNPDQNTINIQNRLATVTASLPKVIVSRGINVRAITDTQLMVIGLYSPDNTLNPLQLSDYANRYLVKPLSRVNGVADVHVSKTTTVHVALDMNKIKTLNLSLTEIANAIEDQNQSVAVGNIGQMPANKNQAFSFSITTSSLLNSDKQIRNIIVKTTAQGAVIHLSDIATISRESDNTSTASSTLNGKSTTFINIFQQPDANALKVAQGVKQSLAHLSKSLPGNIATETIIDTSSFINVSVHEVIQTLIEAIILVILIVFLFLQNWRATLIPAVTIPIALIGSLTFIYMLNYSINMISLFALVLSIGIVVDDAIIVIENVERHIREHHLTPKQATVAAMKEITAPVLVTTCVLLSVFFAVAFLPGIQGKIFQQFSIVLSITVAISAIVALTLSPALCSTILTSKDKPVSWLHYVATFINKITFNYAASVTKLLRNQRWVIVLLMIILLSSFFALKKLPGGFIPEEDQGFLKIFMELPQTLSTEKVNQISSRLSNIIMHEKGVKNVAIIPDSRSDGNGIMGFVKLTPWSQRKSNDLSSEALIQKLQKKLSVIPNSKVFIYNPPLIHDGSMGKLNLQLQSTSGHSLDELAYQANEFSFQAQKMPQIASLFSSFDTSTPAFDLSIDKNKAKALGVSLDEIRQNLSILTPKPVSRLQQNGQEYDINLQVAYPFRNGPKSLDNIYVHNNQGRQISLGSLITLTQTHIASWIPHYNLYRAARLSGQPAPGYSTSEAIQAINKLTKDLPPGYTYTWSGQTLEQLNATKMLPWLFTLAIVFIYLFLVALYESWAVPFSVLLIIPVALSGACFVLLVCGMENNLYAQIGMLLLIGMTAKSTILMTEFSIKARNAGKSIKEAASVAARLRFRPVIMTSLSFTLGVVPLLFSSGPGANSRFYLGVTIIAGMLAATIIGTLCTPPAYAFIQKVREKIKSKL